MADKLLIIALSSAIGLCIGRFFYKKYENLRKYYENLINFIDKLQNNLTFKQENLRKFVEESKTLYDEIFYSQLCNFEGYLSGKNEVMVCAQVDEEVSNKVKNFFLALGTTDIFTQKEILINEKSYFLERLEVSKENLTKKGALMLKICLLAGVLVGILLI